MEEKKKLRPQPGVTGVVISALLIASRFFGSADAVALRSMNTVLVLVMLIFCLHLVRGTSLWRQPHVWNAWNTLALFLMPLIMLLITALQLIMEPPAFFTSYVFSAALIALSMPIFLCCYFWYASWLLPENRALRVFSRVLAVAGILYAVLRLTSAVILPLIEDLSGKTIAPWLTAVTGWNPHLSFAISVFSLGGFVLLCAEDAKKRDKEKE